MLCTTSAQTLTSMDCETGVDPIIYRRMRDYLLCTTSANQWNVKPGGSHSDLSIACDGLHQIWNVVTPDDALNCNTGSLFGKDETNHQTAADDDS